MDPKAGRRPAHRTDYTTHEVTATRTATLARSGLRTVLAGLADGAAAEAGPYLGYRDVLAAGLRGVATELGFEPTAEEAATFGGSVADWPAFPDSAAALARLKERLRLGVITNCDDDLFAASTERLGVEFDWIVTTQQVGS